MYISLSSYFFITSLDEKPRCQGATHGPRREVVLDALFAKAEVRELHMAIRIQQDVLGLQVPVNDVQPVQVLYGQEDLTGVEPLESLRAIDQKIDENGV